MMNTPTTKYLMTLCGSSPPGKGFKSMRSAKATILAIEAFRTVKRGHVFQPPENPAAEIRFIQEEFKITT